MIRLSKNGKRLGRPPKDTESTGKVFIIDAPQQVMHTVETDYVETKKPADFGEIECSFVKIPQYSHVSLGELRDGRYSTSPARVKGLGTKQWVVLAYLKANFNAHRSLKKSDIEITQACLNYLNNSTSKYGYLSLVSNEIKFVQKNGEQVAVLELSTNQRTNSNFWGEGEKM